VESGLRSRPIEGPESCLLLFTLEKKDLPSDFNYFDHFMRRRCLPLGRARTRTKPYRQGRRLSLREREARRSPATCSRARQEIAFGAAARSSTVPSTSFRGGIEPISVTWNAHLCRTPSTQLRHEERDRADAASKEARVCEAQIAAMGPDIYLLAIRRGDIVNAGQALFSVLALETIDPSILAAGDRMLLTFRRAAGPERVASKARPLRFAMPPCYSASHATPSLLIPDRLSPSCRRIVDFCAAEGEAICRGSQAAATKRLTTRSTGEGR